MLELPEVIDARAQADSGFASELRSLVNEADAAGVDIGSIAQTVWGDQNVQNPGVVGSEITVAHGEAPRQR